MCVPFFIPVEPSPGSNSGFVPYAGTIYTNGANLDAWQGIVDDNPLQATGVMNQIARLSGLQTNLSSAFTQINGLPASVGYTSVLSTSLDGLNTQNGISETFVINVTSGLTVSSQIDITGDATDAFILRWDSDANSANGYQGQAKFQSGGAIVLREIGHGKMNMRGEMIGKTPGHIQ